MTDPDHRRRPRGDGHCSPHVVHVLEAYGGVETYVRLMLGHWPDRPNFTFVLAHDGVLADDLRRGGYRVEVVPMPRANTPVPIIRSAVSLRSVLRRLDPDVVHLHSTQAGLVGRLAWGRTGAVVYTPHAYYYLGYRGPRRWLFRTVERSMSRLAPGRVLATSPSEARRAVHDVGVDPAATTTLLNGVEVKEVDPRTHPGSLLRVGMVGRIAPQKDVSTFLRTVRRLGDDDRFEFHLVGVGHYRDDRALLSRMMRSHEVEESRVRIHPWLSRDALEEWWSTCDVALLTSSYESFGYTLAEASARGIPVIGTEVDGIRDVVADGVSGHLVPPGDDAALALRLERLAEDPGHYEALSRGGLALARKRLDIEVFVRRLGDYYTAVAGSSPAGGSAALNP